MDAVQAKTFHLHRKFTRARHMWVTLKPDWNLFAGKASPSFTWLTACWFSWWWYLEWWQLDTIGSTLLCTLACDARLGWPQSIFTDPWLQWILYRLWLWWRSIPCNFPRFRCELYATTGETLPAAARTGGCVRFKVQPFSKGPKVYQVYHNYLSKMVNNQPQSAPTPMEGVCVRAFRFYLRNSHFKPSRFHDEDLQQSVRTWELSHSSNLQLGFSVGCSGAASHLQLGGPLTGYI